MGDYTYSVSGLVNTGVADPLDSSLDIDTTYPVSTLASAGGTAAFKLSDNISLSLATNLWAGYDNQILNRSANLQSTILRWYEDRYTVFKTRTPFSPKDNIFGINELSATLGFDSIGLKLKVAPFSQIESLAYPYTHNVAGGFQSLQLAGFDTTSPADIYNPYIGPVAAVIWDAPFLQGLQFLYQLGTAGGPVGDGVSGAMKGTFDFSKLFHTAQVKYTHSFENGTTLTGAVYLTDKDPAEPKTATGEDISDTFGVGTSLMLNIPNKFSANFGYSYNSTDRTGKGVKINSRFDGVNLSVDVPVQDILHIAAGYSWLGFTEKTEAFVSGTEKTSEHALDLKLVFPFLDGKLGLTTGYRGTFVDSDNSLDPSAHNIHVFSLGLQGLLGGSL